MIWAILTIYYSTLLASFSAARRHSPSLRRRSPPLAIARRCFFLLFRRRSLPFSAALPSTRFHSDPHRYSLPCPAATRASSLARLFPSFTTYYAGVFSHHTQHTGSAAGKQARIRTVPTISRSSLLTGRVSVSYPYNLQR